MRLRLVIAACVASLALAFGSPALGVQSVVVQGADTAGYPKIVLTVVVSPDAVARPQDVPDIAVTENGVARRDVTVSSLHEERGPIDVVLLMDTSGSMKGRPLSDSKAAAHRFVESMQPSDRIAIVAFSSEPVVLQEFTSDRAALSAAIDGLTASGETALYDGLVRAAALSASAVPERYIVALSDGGDTQSLNPPDNAARAVTDARMPVYAVALESPEYNPATLETIASVSGGRMTSVSDSAELTDIYQSIAAEMQLRYRVEFVSGRPNPPELDLLVSVGSGQDAATTGFVVRNPLFEASRGVSRTLERAHPSGLALVATLVSSFLAVAMVAAAAGLI